APARDGLHRSIEREVQRLVLYRAYRALLPLHSLERSPSSDRAGPRLYQSSPLLAEYDSESAAGRDYREYELLAAESPSAARTSCEYPVRGLTAGPAVHDRP